ncbi:MAG: aspartate 1-decarboxylase [Ignavibacteria bacterium]|jgi:aspartate 1-decarboxylase|nr:aspartate 1-decarboxylase [Ignavibacteria bacterium]
MKRSFLKSKIHRAVITQTELHYEGSLTIDKKIMEEADVLELEKVSVVNINNGERFETYVIPGERGSGTICLNGAAARKAIVGDKVIIMTFCDLDETEISNFEPKIILLDEDNKIKSVLNKIEVNNKIN